MTNPMGRSFISYRRTSRDEAALLVQAQHDHGIPTWQDIRDLEYVPTEDELRRVLGDSDTANAVIFITPDVEDSAIIRKVEVAKILGRVSEDDRFFAVPIVAGGLTYESASAAAGNHLSAQTLASWNMEKLTSDTLTVQSAASVAGRILTQRIRAIHEHTPHGQPLGLGFYVRRAAPVAPGTALLVDWSGRFDGKEATPETWSTVLLPAIRRVAVAIGQHAPGREIHAFGYPTLPAAMALGCAFLATGGTRLTWLQRTPKGMEEQWGLHVESAEAGFRTRTTSDAADARDVAILVSVSDNVEPVFADCRRNLPPIRAVVHVSPVGGNYPFITEGPGEAVDIAQTVQVALREVRREYGAIGTVHIFAAVPAGLAVMIGQLLNTFGAVQTYEHVPVDGSGCYRPGPLLLPSA